MSESVNVQVVLKKVRLSYPALFTPTAMEDDNGESKPTYSASFLIDPQTTHGQENINAMKRAIVQVMQARWPERGEDGKLKVRLSPDRLCLRDGDHKRDKDGYAGMMYVSSRAQVKYPPQIVGRNRLPITEASNIIYAGCYVNAIIRLWPQDDKKWGRRVNASLEAVQFDSDGDPFGAGRVDPTAVFDDLTGSSAAAALGADVDDFDII